MPFLGGRGQASRGYFGGGTTPNAPTSLVSTKGNGQISVAFTAPGFDGGLPITTYQYALSTDSYATFTTRSAGTTGSPLVITGLTNGTSYGVKIRAVNSLGNGLTSDAATAVTPSTVPNAPTITSSPSNINGQVTVSWNALTGANTGGAGILSYTLQHSASSTFASGVVTVTGIASTSHMVSSLTNGTTRYFKVLGVNLNGDGAYSGTASATPSTIPDAPTSLSSTPGDQQLFIAFTPPVFDGGLTITNYKYAVSSNSGSTYSSFTALSPVDATSPVTIPGLTNGTTYYVKLRAVNALGDGTESSPVTTNTIPYGNPIVTTGAGSDTTAAANTPTTNAATSVESFSTLVTVPYYSSSGTWPNPHPAGQATGTGTLNGSAGTTSFIWGTTSGSYPNEVSATSNAYVGTTWPRGTTVYYKAKTSNSSCAFQSNGTVNANGSSTTVTFEYGTVSGVYPSSVTATQSPVTGASNTSVSATASSLNAGTYYFRVKAVNSSGTTYGDQGSVTIAVTSAVAASQQSFTPPAVTTLYELLAVGGGAGPRGGSGGGGGAVSYYSSAAAPASLAYAVGGGGGAGGVGGNSTIIFTGGAGISMSATGGAIGTNPGYDFGGNSGVASGGTSNYPASAFTGGQGGNIGDSDYGNGGGAGAGGNGGGYNVFENSQQIYAYGGNGGPAVTINYPLGGSNTFGAGGGGHGTDYLSAGGGPSIGTTPASDYGRGGFRAQDYNSVTNGQPGLVRFRYYGP